jgi:hypothetical protein
MIRPLLIASGFLLTLLIPAAPPVTSTTVTNSDAPAYTAKGDLVMPVNYREWVFLTSGIDMSYTASSKPDHSMFDNVFVNPASYKTFVATGTWPDKTTFILEVRGAENPVSINKRGHTQSPEVMGTEIHVKDNGKWSFYDLPGGAKEANLIPPPASCYSCHQEHAAVDTTFVQFYPTLMPIAQQKNTLSPAYLKEIAEPAK